MRLPHRLALLSLLTAPIAITSLVAACAVEGAISPAAPTPAPAGDGGPDDAFDPCGSTGALLAVTVRSDESAGGDVTAFADCFDGGAIAPTEIEGECKLYPATAFSDPGKLAGTNIAHGTVRVSQATSGVDVTLATREVRASFEGPLAAGEDVRVELGGTAAIAAEAFALPVAQRVAVTDADGGARAARSDDLTIAFSGGAPTELVTVSLVTEAREEIRCSAPAESGAIVVSSKLLTKLPAGPAELQVASVAPPTTSPRGVTGQVRMIAVRGARTIELE